MKLALGQHGVHLTLMCHDAPPLMELRVRNFEPVGSEERMSFGAGAEPYVFVAQLDEEGLGVTGERDISDDFLNALSAETQWRVNYGSQDTGLLDAPPAEATQSFVAACRAIVAG